MPMPERFSFEDAQVKKDTFGWDEATGKKPVPKQPMPDVKTIEQGIEEQTKPSAVLSQPEVWGQMVKNIPGAVAGTAEFIASGVGALAQMDFTAFANLGILSKEHADKINSAIANATDPTTEAGQLLNKWGGEIFTFAPQHAKDFAKKLGASDEGADHVYHLVEAGELATGLKRGGLKPEEVPKPKVEPTMEGAPKAPPPPPISPATLELGREGELMPKEIRPTPKGLPQPAIEGKAVEIKGELPAPSKALPSPQAKLANFEIAKADKNSIATVFDNKHLDEVVMEDPYKRGEISNTYETTPDKLGQIPEGSSISFGNIEQGGTGVSLTKNTIPGEGPYRLTEWQDSAPIKHAPYPDFNSAMADFQKHASRPDANGIVPNRIQVTEAPGDETAAQVAKWVPPNQRGMIDPSVFLEGLGKLYSAIDQSEAMNTWRKFARPLQAGEYVIAGQVKDFANLRRVAQYQRDVDHKQLDQIPRELRSTMIRSIEKPELGNQLPPEIKTIKDRLVNENEALSAQAFDLKIIGNIRKPYAPHVIKQMRDDPVMAEQLRKQGYIRTTVRPRGARKYETFEAGEAEGVEYIDDIKALADINYQLKESIYGKHFVNYIKQFKLSTGDSFATEPGMDMPGYVSINHPAFFEKKYWKEQSVEVEGNKYFAKDNKVTIGNDVHAINDGKIYRDGKLYTVTSRSRESSYPIKVHPDIAAPLKSILEASDPSLITKALVGLKASTIGIIMYNPAFHNMTVFGKIMPSLPGAGFGEFIWNPRHIVGEEIYNKLTPVQKALTRTWVSDYSVGNYLNQLPDKVTDAIKHNVVFIGGRGYRADLYGDMAPVRQNILYNISEGLGDSFHKFGDFWHGTLLWDRIADAQHGIYNRMSNKLAEDGIEKFTKESGRMPTPTELKQIQEDSKFMAGEMANTLVGAFGKEDFGPKWRDFLNSTLFSRSYTMSNVRLAQYASGIIPRHLLVQMERLTPINAQKLFTGIALATVAKDLFLMFGTLEGLNYINTKFNKIPDKYGNINGHFSWDNDPGREMYIALGQKKDGTVVYLGIPFRAARDIAEMAIKPATLWNNKINPWIKTMYEELTNRDWRGKQIRLDGDAWKQEMQHSASHMVRGITGFDNTYNTFNPDDESWRNRYRLLGGQVATGTPGGPVRGNLLAIQREQQAQKDLVMQDATEDMRRGHDDQAIKLLLDNNLVSEIPGFVLRSKDPEASTLLRLKWGKLYMRATPEQKQELDKIKFGTQQK